MKLTIFESRQGRLPAAGRQAGELVLCDGGMGRSMSDMCATSWPSCGRGTRARPRVHLAHRQRSHQRRPAAAARTRREWRVFDHHQAANGEPVKSRSSRARR